MDNDNRIRLLSLLSDGCFHSGEILARNLSISRAAIWKIIQNLESWGLEIQAVKGRGYKLLSKVEFLDVEILNKKLDRHTKRLINKLDVYQELASTNDYLFNNTALKNIHSHVVLSEYQTSGKGRRGNSWLSPFAGGINLSIGWHFEYPVDSVMQLSLAMGVAVIKSFIKLDIHNVGLKWPNDFFCNNKKIGGLLIETRGESAGPFVVVVGIGVNYSISENIKYMSVDQPWTDVASITTPLPSKNELATYLITEVIGLLNNYHDTASSNYIAEWRKYDCMKGQIVNLKLPGKTVTGRVEGIDDSGSILISSGKNISSFTAGEINLKVIQ